MFSVMPNNPLLPFSTLGFAHGPVLCIFACNLHRHLWAPDIAEFGDRHPTPSTAFDKLKGVPPGRRILLTGASFLLICNLPQLLSAPDLTASGDKRATPGTAFEKLDGVPLGRRILLTETSVNNAAIFTEPRFP